MMTSVQTTPSVSTLKQRLRPNLKLNVNQKAFEEEAIMINRNNTASYVIQNHPKYTDHSEFSFSTQKKYDQIFFTKSMSPQMADDHSQLGDFYYVIQRANGKDMQDRYKIRTASSTKDVSFFGVYDGHTTHLIAELLSKKLDECLFENLQNIPDMKHAIKQAFETLETEVMHGLREHKPRGGSTVLCNLLHEYQLYSANLGDSRSVVFRNEDFALLSNLHDFSNESERAFAIQKGGSLFKNRLEGELAISRSIGDVNFKAFMSSEPEIEVYNIQNGDEFLLLGTDGFWNGLSPEQCLTKIQEFKQTKDCAAGIRELGDFLIEEAKKNIQTKKDNMTLVVIDLGQYLQRMNENQASKMF